MADACLEAGFTYFDTGYPYHKGNSETAFREAVVKRHPRDSFTITDKMPMFFVKDAVDLQKFFAEQLQCCGASEKRCPQYRHISDSLKLVAPEFEKTIF